MKKLAVPVIRTLSRFFATAAVALTFVSAPISIDTAKAQQSATEQEAYAIGVDAYLYFYSLVTMDITRKQLTNVEHGKGINGPMNTFSNISEYPPADMKVVVRPNFDTLYSSGWLDLTKGLQSLHAPARRPVEPCERQVGRFSHEGRPASPLPVQGKKR
jgi:hypothetical protein